MYLRLVVVVKPFGNIGKVGIQVVFNILTAICTKVNHCVVSIHDYLTVLQTVGKVVNVYQKKEEAQGCFLGLRRLELFVDSTGSFQQM